MAWTADIDLSQKSAETVIFIVTAIYVLICTPVSMYFVGKLWKLYRAKVAFITKRHAKIVICSVISFNIFPTVIRPITDLGRLHSGSVEWTRPQLFFLQIMQYCVIFICIRLWLLWYDYTSEVQTLNEKWQSQITKDQTISTWTLKHRWAGNPKIVTLIACTFATVVVIIVVILGDEYLQITQVVPALYIIFIVVLMFKIRKCRDEFYIRKEFFVIMIWFVGCVIVYVGLIVALIPTTSNIRVVASNIWTSIGSYVACLISTHWVIRQYNKQRTDEVQLARVVSKSQDSMNPKKHNLSLEDILSTMDGFDLFANHLVKEFSIENLAFVFEVMQIKNEAKKHGLIDDDDIGFIIPMAEERINKVRRKDSYIYGKTELQNNVKYVVDQYIFQGSEYSVNISSFTRINVLNVWTEIDKNTAVARSEKEKILKYVTIFDIAVQEISSLLRTDSLPRFYRSKEYKLMIKDAL